MSRLLCGMATARQEAETIRETVDIALAAGLPDTVVVAVAAGGHDLSLVLPAAATLLAALIVGYIAWRESKTSREKLKLDLFDRRFAVFRSAEDFIYAVLADPSVPIEHVHAFNHGTKQASFLFEQDVVGHLTSLRENALELRTLATKLGGSSMLSDDDRVRAIRRDEELVHEFTKALNDNATKFARYLDFQRPG